MAAVGWYPDAQDPSLLRYWDGARWTHEHRAGADGPPIPIADVERAPVPTPSAAPPAWTGTPPATTPAADAPGPAAPPFGLGSGLDPSWAARGIALAVDTVVVYGVPAVVTMALTSSTAVAPAGLVVAVVLLVVDFGLLQGLTAQSVGKRVASIAVVDPVTHQRVGVIRSLVRTAVSILSLILFVLVALYDLNRLRSRGDRLCDGAARTIIVRADHVRAVSGVARGG